MGFVEIARLFIEKGACVNARISSGETSLHWAASQGHVDILHLLAERGADLEAQDNDGWKALHFAVCTGDLSFIKELVLKYHVDINPRDFLHEKTPMTVALNSTDPNTHSRGIEIAAFLIVHGTIE